MAWRSDKPPGTEKPRDPKLAAKTVQTKPSRRLAKVAETVSSSAEGIGVVIFEDDRGHAVAIDAALAPMLDGLTPMLVDSLPLTTACAVAGVDTRGRVHVYIMEFLV